MSVLDGRSRPTQRRTAAAKALRNCDRFVSAQELHMCMVAEGARIGLSTVYRTLRDLEEAGTADVLQAGAGEKLYRWRGSGEHQHYLACRLCGSSRPVKSEIIEEWVADIISDTGFAAVEHTVELAGICAHCQHAAD